MLVHVVGHASVAPDDPKEDMRFLVYSYRTRQPCKARKESMRNNRNWKGGEGTAASGRV